MAAVDIEKQIYDPERGKSIRAQNTKALKKAGKVAKEFVSKKGGAVKSLAKGAARFAAPVVGAVDASQRMAQDPTNIENILTSGVKSQAKFIDEPISAISNLISGRSFTPVRTSLDAISAGAEGLGAGAQSYFGADKPFEEAAAEATRVRELSLRRRQGEAAQEPSVFEGVSDLTGIGTSIPEPTQEEVAPEGLGEAAPYRAGTTIREGQTPEGFTRRVEGARGGFGEITTAEPTTVQTPEQVQEALAGVEARSDVRVQNLLRQQEQADPAVQQNTRIQELEEQLAQPGRGLRQSFGDLMAETQGRRTARKELDALYKQQGLETTQAGQTQRAALVSRDKARDRSMRYRELIGREGAAAKKEQRSIFKEAQADYRAQAKDRFPDDPKQQSFYEAELLESHLPGSAWDTTAGRAVRKDAVIELNKAADDERGFFDWAAQFLGGSKPRTAEDYHKLDFEGWSVNDKGEILLPEAIINNDAFRNKDGNYAYFDNMSPQTVWFIRQLVNKANAKNKSTSLRKGQ